MTSESRPLPHPTLAAKEPNGVGPASPKRDLFCGVLARRVLCLLGVCLLLAGCNLVGESPRKPIDGLRLFPTGLSSKADKELEEAVANDPFPKASDADLRVCVSQ